MLKEIGGPLFHWPALLLVWCSSSLPSLCRRKILLAENALNSFSQDLIENIMPWIPHLQYCLFQNCSHLFWYTGSLWYSLDFYRSQKGHGADMHSRLPPSKYQIFLQGVQQQTWNISSPLYSLYSLCNWGTRHQRSRVVLQCNFGTWKLLDLSRDLGKSVGLGSISATGQQC